MGGDRKKRSKEHHVPLNGWQWRLDGQVTTPGELILMVPRLLGYGNPQDGRRIQGGGRDGQGVRERTGGERPLEGLAGRFPWLVCSLRSRYPDGHTGSEREGDSPKVTQQGEGRAVPGSGV